MIRNSKPGGWCVNILLFRCQKSAGATSAFDRMLNKHGIVSGVGGVDVQNAAKIAELEALARDNRVKERLAALKSKKSGS